MRNGTRSPWWEGTEAEVDWLCAMMHRENVSSAMKVLCA